FPKWWATTCGSSRQTGRFAPPSRKLLLATCTNALSAVPSELPDFEASLASWSINLAGLHGVAPAQRMGVGQISSGCRYVAGLNQGAELKVNRIHIGVPIGKMSKAAVRIATAQHPVCSLLDRSADRLRFAAQLPEYEDRIETSEIGRASCRERV